MIHGQLSFGAFFFNHLAFLCLNTESHTYQFRHTNENG